MPAGTRAVRYVSAIDPRRKPAAVWNNNVRLGYRVDTPGRGFRRWSKQMARQHQRSAWQWVGCATTCPWLVQYRQTPGQPSDALQKQLHEPSAGSAWRPVQGCSRVPASELLSTAPVGLLVLTIWKQLQPCMATIFCSQRIAAALRDVSEPPPAQVACAQQSSKLLLLLCGDGEVVCCTACCYVVRMAAPGQPVSKGGTQVLLLPSNAK